VPRHVESEQYLFSPTSDHLPSLPTVLY
jgi:hypothetical protein